MANKEVSYIGFKPFSHQKAVISELKDAKGTGKIVVCKSSRQKGKSMLIENILLYYALNYANTTSICVSPVLSQSRKVYRDIVDAIVNTKAIKKKNESLLEMELVNGSKLFFKSAEQKDSLRGYVVSGILCIDECAFIPSDIFYLMLPWTDVHKAPILMCSSPFVREGFFWDYYNRGRKGTNIVSIDWCDREYKEDIDKLLPPERLEEYRKILPASQFRSEYLGEFLDDAGSVFIGFKDCVYANIIMPDDKLYVGIDWGNGGGNDDTVISILNDKGQQVYLEYWNNLTTTRQIDKMVRILEPIKNQIVLVQPELNSIGTPYTDLLKNRLQIKNIQGFNTTNKSKNDIVAQMQVAFEQRKVTILDDEQQLKELGTYMVEYNAKTKTVTYNAPQGMHDDICIALMLSYDAFIRKSNKGHYTISVL